MNTPEETRTFHGLGIAPKLLGILSGLKIQNPTPIQRRAIPHGIAGKDVIGVAQTGTGKTLAFGIPLIQRLAGDAGGRALVVLPTRELALQVDETLARLGRAFGLKTAVVIGGVAIGPQTASLRRDPHVIIATPGRLLDHLAQGTFKPGRISVVVFDEADRMLDMGFWPQVKRIVGALPPKRQTMLFSATLSKEILEIATKHMQLPVSIEVAPPGTTVERVTQEFFIVRKEDKTRLLEKVLGQYSGAALVFVRTKHGAKKLTRGVLAMGHSAAEIHGNRSLSQRRDALAGFKTGRYRVLVATDVASRGIDVKGIELVINYDLPKDSTDYVHRIGRTARAGAAGRAVSFVMPEEKRGIRDIERLIRKPLFISRTPELPPARFVPASMRSGERRFPRQRPFPPRPHGYGRGSRRSGRGR